jgi:hypothetical protein
MPVISNPLLHRPVLSQKLVLRDVCLGQRHGRTYMAYRAAAEKSLGRRTSTAEKAQLTAYLKIAAAERSENQTALLTTTEIRRPGTNTAAVASSACRRAHMFAYR